MDLSILLPVSNHLELTQECLSSLERTVHGLRWEVIVVDDASTDGTGEFLRGLFAPRYRTVASGGAGEGPRGPAACFNLAARMARAPVLCALSPAAVLMPGWLAPMRRLLARSPGAGCIGNVHREPISGLIEYTGFLFNVEGMPADAGRSTTAPPTEVLTRWPAVLASCCLFAADLHESLGGFNERLPLELAGIDFCLRATGTHRTHHYTANGSVIYVHTEVPEEGPAVATGPQVFRELWGERARAYQQWEQAQAAAEHELIRRMTGEAIPLPAGQGFTAEHWEDFCRSRERLWHRRWEVAREERRQWRQDIIDAREDGWRYLRKHLLHPWRYNLGRAGRALMQVTHPMPPAIPKPPRFPRARHARALIGGGTISDDAGLDHPDAELFNPPAD